MEIKIGGNYKPVNSDIRVHRILAIDGIGVQPVIIEMSDGRIETYSLDGKYRESGTPSSMDLVECSPYDYLKVDDKVLVWDNIENDKQRRYFAGISSNGEPMTFSNGMTSWSNGKCSLVVWKNCIKADI